MRKIKRPYFLAALVAILVICIAAFSQLSGLKAEEKGIDVSFVNSTVQEAFAAQGTLLSIDTSEHFDQAVKNESLCSSSLERSLKEVSTLFALVFRALGLLQDPAGCFSNAGEYYRPTLSTPVYILFRKLIL